MSVQYQIRLAAIRESALFARAARASTGLTQTEFAKRAGIARRTLCVIENASCTKPPSIETIIKIATATGKNLHLSLGD